jgi:hypothetical protein
MSEDRIGYSVALRRATGPRHGCHRTEPLPHPWLPIADAACGFDDRLTAPKCQGCRRARAESPMVQLDQLDGRGDVARLQEDVCHG